MDEKIMTEKYKCSVCGKEFYRADTAKKCTHGNFATAIVKNTTERELKDIRFLKDNFEIKTANKIMAARKALERALNYDED